MVEQQFCKLHVGSSILSGSSNIYNTYKMKKMSEEQYLKRCLKFLDYFGIDYSKDTIRLTDGGNSVVFNTSRKFSKVFIGHSINEVSEYVAKKLNKKTIWID
jgi:hypothetical protein